MNDKISAILEMLNVTVMLTFQVHRHHQSRYQMKTPKSTSSVI